MNKQSDDVFAALSHAERRRLLVELLYEDRVRLGEWSGGGSGRDSARLRLVHVHLPKLVAFGFVEWDRDAAVVAAGPRFDRLVPILELLDELSAGDVASVPLDANGPD